jgi:tRNA G26 N,N-dimethylase Trm1
VIDNICSRLKRDVPALEDVLDAVRAKGFASSPTHFHPKAIKTAASISVLEDTVSSI